jgi:hypothetical protein
VGITYEVARFMLEARPAAGFGSTLTLGRLQLFLSSGHLGSLAREFGLPGDSAAAGADRYSERFLTTYLGAAPVSAMDFSPYEGASLIHDLNVPIGSEHAERFDTVIDGGTLEHVFNFPVALANCMRLLKVGGRLWLCTPGNSLMGHGFYQFSPELLYRSLAPAHGFEVEALQVIRSRYVSTELETVGEPLEALDPERLGTRTVVMSRDPLSLLVRARKLRHLDTPFATPPQQSDYVQAWASADRDGRPAHSTLAGFVEAAWRRLPGRLKWKLWNEYGRWYRQTPRNRAWFRPAGRHGGK